MNKEQEKECCRSKCIAVALIRWSLGLVFLVGGVSKFFMYKGFVTGYLVPAFAKTFLPVWMITAYGYALPFVETLVGVLLIAGILRTATALVAGLTLISLAFGQMLIQGHGIVANIMLYLLMTAVILFWQEHDGWACCGARCQDGNQGPD